MFTIRTWHKPHRGLGSFSITHEQFDDTRQSTPNSDHNLKSFRFVMCMRIVQTISDLPEEVLLHILTFLAIPDLLQLSRTCHRFRVLATDPLLHQLRIRYASQSLARALARRPSRNTISPPNAWIWLSRTYTISRSISRSLIRIRLSHSLEHRPTLQELVKRAVLPLYSINVSPVIVQSQQAVLKKKLAKRLETKLECRPNMKILISLNIIPEDCANLSVSPVIFEQRKKVMRETLKDGLRRWIGSKGVQAQKERAAELEDTERITVKDMVRRFAALKESQELDYDIDPISLEKKRARSRWGRGLEMQKCKDQRRTIWGGFTCPYPTRAHVLGLKRFYESVINSTQ